MCISCSRLFSLFKGPHECQGSFPVCLLKGARFPPKWAEGSWSDLLIHDLENGQRHQGIIQGAVCGAFWHTQYLPKGTQIVAAFSWKDHGCHFVGIQGWIIL